MLTELTNFDIKDLGNTLIRRDIEYIMNNGDVSNLADNVHYIFLSYLRDGKIIKVLSQYSDIDDIYLNIAMKKLYPYFKVH